MAHSPWANLATACDLRVRGARQTMIYNAVNLDGEGLAWSGLFPRGCPV